MEQIKPSLLFTSYPHEALAQELACHSSLECRTFLLDHFPNQELCLALSTSVANRNCVILGSLTPPEIHLVTFLMLCHTLKKDKAKQVSACIPYLAYSRHEKDEPQKSQMTALVGALLKAAGLDSILTLDLHNPKKKDLFPIPIHSISPAKLFAEEIRRLALTEATIVAPDKGAIARCEDLAQELEKKENLIWIEKMRDQKNIFHYDLRFGVKKQALIVDDILDTGQTLISCCEKLVEKGAQEMVVMITHGLFTGEKWKELFDIGVTKIYCTDSVPLSSKLQNDPRIQVLSVAPLLLEALSIYSP